MFLPVQRRINNVHQVSLATVLAGFTRQTANHMFAGNLLAAQPANSGHC